MSDGISATGCLQDKIWITSRVRMMAEKRLLKYNNWSLFLLAYYSAFTVIISVFSEYFETFYSQFDGATIAASVAVLVASLVVSGFRFERTASLYRDCYLSLQRLYEADDDADSKDKKYADILAVCPNHSSSDNYDFLVSHILLEGKNVWSAGREKKLTKYMITSFFFRRFVFCSLIFILAIMPLAFALGPLVAHRV